jgi:hypothetical protein
MTKLLAVCCIAGGFRSGHYTVFGNCSMTNLSLARGSLFFLLLLMVSASAVARPAVVVIDPGHGGSDRGGMPGQRLAEKGFTLDTAKRLARVLGNGNGIKVGDREKTGATPTSHRMSPASLVAEATASRAIPRSKHGLDLA